DRSPGRVLGGIGTEGRRAHVPDHRASRRVVGRNVVVLRGDEERLGAPGGVDVEAVTRPVLVMLVDGGVVRPAVGAAAAAPARAASTAVAAAAGAASTA